MKILYVYGMARTKDIVYTLQKMGYEVEEYPKIQENSVFCEQEMEELVQYIYEHKITHVMSIHLIYNIPIAAWKAGIKYISVIWDAPYIKIYTPFGKLPSCWFSVFDRLDCERFQRDGIAHVLYQKLAVNKGEVIKWNRKVEKKRAGRYMNDVCFVGRLYEDNLYDKYINYIPENMRQYFESIFEEAAFQWDGVNRIYGKTSSEILEYIKLVSPDFEITNRLDISDVEYFERLYLVRKVANIERIAILSTLSEMYSTTFYTDSTFDKEQLGKVKVMPPIAPGEAASYVYAGSKINLNISLKGIEGGTPQRIMDVMAAGGFMLTNYCEETAELFQEDEEIVMFKTPEELVEKIDYYLKHDKEREAIAKAGQKKVLSCYTYEQKLAELLEWVEGEEA